MNHDHALTDAIRLHIRMGHGDHARELLDASLERDPDHAEHLYLRGTLNAAAGANRAALADFDAALRLLPGLPPVLFSRGLILFRLERMDEALTDFETLADIQPDSVDVWTNIGIIHTREGRPEAAIKSLRRASLLAPESPLVLRMLANALRDVGEYSESTRLHRMVVESTPADPAALTDYALSLLSLGEIVKAHEQYQRALVTAPGDQTALAGIYMTSNELGMGDVVAALMDYESLLAYGKVATEDQIDLDVLRETVLKHEQLLWEPAGRSTKAGKQSPMLDLSEASPFSRFQRMITRHVERRMRAIGRSSDILGHPWLATVPRKWRLQSWITVLEEGGQQTPHIHPAGWLSGVFYVDAGSPRVSGAGDLVFGRAQQDLPLQRRMPERRHRPIGGELVMFPSYFFHNTTPYAGDGPRISLAFDVIPVER